MKSSFFNNYFLILISLLPFSILAGPAISLSLIILLDISFLFFFLKQTKEYKILFNNDLKFLILLFAYLIFNSLISLDISSSLLRNLGFLRIIILFVAINYFFLDDSFQKKVMKIWMITIGIVIFDVFYEFSFEKNILGYTSDNGNRLVSFFKDELIVGGFLNAFYLMIIGFLLNYSKEKNKYKILVFSLIFLLAIFLTGERSNSLKALLGVITFIILLPIFDFKKKLLIFISIVILITSALFYSPTMKTRFVHQIKHILSNKDISYSQIYLSGYQVFLNNPIFGVGNKNYRVETCHYKDTKKNLNKKTDLYICETHPHQIYLEFLTEHGIVGSIILLFILFKLIFSKIKLIISNRNYLQLGSFIYLILVFLPILPSGAFFGDYSLTVFSLNLSLLYAVNKKTNIFKINM